MNDYRMMQLCREAELLHDRRQAQYEAREELAFFEERDAKRDELSEVNKAALARKAKREAKEAQQKERAENRAAHKAQWEKDVAIAKANTKKRKPRIRIRPGYPI